MGEKERNREAAPTMARADVCLSDFASLHRVHPSVLDLKDFLHVRVFPVFFDSFLLLIFSFVMAVLTSWKHRAEREDQKM